MFPKKCLSRRTFLRGAGGVVIALPFLDAMIPAFASKAFGATTQPVRWVTIFYGSSTATTTYSQPAAGALGSSLPQSWSGLNPVAQHVSIVKNLTFPTYLSGSTPTAPGSALNVQHGGVEAPLLAGVTRPPTTALLVVRQTADQYAADVIGAGTRINSLQLRVQAENYSNSSATEGGIMSARYDSSGTANALPPMVSPLAIYNLLFSNATSSTSTTPSLQLQKEKSVLDLVLGDANRLLNSLGGADQQKLSDHFDQIRALETSITQSMSGTGSTGPSCTIPASPGPDPAVGPDSFGGWSNETLRGQVMADMIAYAFACDITRVVSWMLTFNQTFLDSYPLSGSTTASPNSTTGGSEIHSDSHNAGANIVSLNCKWASTLMCRLIQNLLNLSDAGGPLLNNTFLSLVTPEGIAAHNKTSMTHVVAGMPSKIKAGICVDATGLHPCQTQISGLIAVGRNSNTLGEVTAGPIPGLMV